MPPHSEVAERFQRLLEEIGLSREEFAAAVDGAISAHSVFSILNGHRRPSRALAVLIERSWGFRADFLLEGEGEMWTQPAYASPSVGGAVLSPVEATVVGFMRGSVENARAIDEQLEIADTWARLLARLNRIADELTECSRSASGRSAYPLLARFLFEEFQGVAEQHEQLVAQLHRLQTHRLLDPMLDRFLHELPASFVSAEQAGRLESLLEPLRIRRAEIRAGLEQALTRSRATFRSLDAPDAIADLARLRAEALGQRRERVARLAELAAAEHAIEARELLAELEASTSDADLAVAWLERVIHELSQEAHATAPEAPRAAAPESLRVRFDEILETFAA